MLDKKLPQLEGERWKRRRKSERKSQINRQTVRHRQTDRESLFIPLLYDWGTNSEQTVLYQNQDMVKIH